MPGAMGARARGGLVGWVGSGAWDGRLGWEDGSYPSSRFMLMSLSLPKTGGWLGFEGISEWGLQLVVLDWWFGGFEPQFL